MKSLLGVLTLACILSAGTVSAKPVSTEAYKNEMRIAWENHLYWKRNVIYNVIIDGAGLKTAIRHLSWNIGQIAELLEPFYGEEATKEISELLHVHSTYASNIAWAIKTKDDKGFDETYCRWISNANAIAGSMRALNENWSLHELQYRWFAQLEFIAELTRNRCEENFDAASSLFSLAHFEIRELADYISQGIITQFPERFLSSEFAVKN